MSVNQKTRVPWWYILRDPPNNEIEITELIKYGEIRTNFLKEFVKLKPNFSNKNYFLINNLIESFYPNYLDKTLNKETRMRYFLGHWQLRIVSVFSERIKSWIIETEGDLFEIMFNKLDIREKLIIFQILAQSEKKVTYVKIIQNDFFIPNELINADNIAVHWTLVPYLVTKKKGALYNGYVIAPFHVFYKSVKKLFEKKLRNKIEKLKENDHFIAFFETNKLIMEEIKKIEKELINTSHYNPTNLFFNEDEIQGVNLFEKLDIFPPCMRYLIQDVKQTGYIKHNYRFQLGLFLKRIGMDIDTQLHFWYNLAVDNIGISYEQFVRRAGYIIRHIYGLEGSRTDYEVPSCKKIKTDYFCLFSHINVTGLRDIIPKMYTNTPEQVDSTIDEITQLASRYLNTEACSKTFQMLFGKKISIFHPLFWIQSGYKITNKEKPLEKDIND